MKSLREGANMLVRFALDLEALATGLTEVNWETRCLHARIIEKWQDYGILVHPGEAFDRSGVYQAIANLPGEIARLYKTALKNNRLRVSPGPANWRGVETADKETDFTNLQGNINLACLDEVRAEYVGLKPSEISREILDGSIEIVRTRTIDQATRFREAERQSRTTIEEGTRVGDVWKDKFADLATFARQIVIVDRFAGESLAIHNANGLPRFLSEIDNTARRATVTIITACKERDSTQVLTALGRFNPSRGGIRKLKLFVAPDNYFKGGPRNANQGGAHDRYVRFDYVVVNLGTGLSVFDGSQVARHCSFGTGKIESVHKEIESQLQQYADSTEVDA